MPQPWQSTLFGPLTRTVQGLINKLRIRAHKSKESGGQSSKHKA